ncbi:MAG: hypothetical protein ABEJ81_06765 [Haloferacaceae archaeon]
MTTVRGDRRLRRRGTLVTPVSTAREGRADLTVPSAPGSVAGRSTSVATPREDYDGR